MPRRIENSVTPATAIADCSPRCGSNVNDVTGAPAAVTPADGSAANVICLSFSVKTPIVFGARAGSRTSDPASLPALFARKN